MTALFGTLAVAAIAAAVSLYTSRAFPTLDRRIRDHTALVKDLPSELTEELRALLATELSELVERDRARFDPRPARGFTWPRRVLLGIAMTAFLGLVITTIIAPRQVLSNNAGPAVTTVVDTLGAIFIVALLTDVSVLVRRLGVAERSLRRRMRDLHL